jgi:hypothetical protein
MQTVTARAINHIGLTKLGNAAGVRPSAAQKWRDKALPESELSGRTAYARLIEQLSEGEYTAEQLLAETRAFWEKRPVRRGPQRKHRRAR